MPSYDFSARDLQLFPEELDYTIQSTSCLNFIVIHPVQHFNYFEQKAITHFQTH